MISGKALTAKIGATTIVGVFNWEAEEVAAELDTTTAADGGFDHPEDGVKSLTVRLRGYMDTVDGEYAPIRRGTTISNLNLFRASTDATAAFVIPTAKVFRSTQGGEIKGRIEWSAEIKAVGSYTYNDP